MCSSDLRFFYFSRSTWARVPKWISDTISTIYGSICKQVIFNLLKIILYFLFFSVLYYNQISHPWQEVLFFDNSNNFYIFSQWMCRKRAFWHVHRILWQLRLHFRFYGPPLHRQWAKPIGLTISTSPRGRGHMTQKSSGFVKNLWYYTMGPPEKLDLIIIFLYRCGFKLMRQYPTSKFT